MRSVSDIIFDSRAEWGVAIRGLNTDFTFEHRSNQPHELASIIKLPILVVLLRQVQAGKLSLRQAVKVEPRHVGLHGSGQLANLHLRLPFELYNLAMLMMTISDNTATNVIIELLTREHINNEIAKLGYPGIKLLTDKFNFPHTYRIGVDATAQGSPADLVSFMARLYAGNLLDSPHTALALKMLRRVGISQLVRHMPPKQVETFGSKTGFIAQDIKQPVVLNEVGYVVKPGGRAAAFAVLQLAPADRRLPWSADAKYRLEMAKFGAAMLRELR